jgi:hypothetical protein
VSEIKVIKSEVEPAFNDLRNKIQSLNTDNPNCHFSHSKLSLTDKIEEIEKSYYETLKTYKEILTNIEQDAWESIESIFHTDQRVSKMMK